MTKKITVLFLSIVAFLTVLSVGSGSGSPAAPAKKAASPGQAGAEWEKVWAKTVSDGKKEGKVVIYTALASNSRVVLGKSFKDKFGIDVEWVAGRGAEAAEKFLTERRGGIYSGDLFIIGGITPFRNWCNSVAILL